MFRVSAEDDSPKIFAEISSVRSHRQFEFVPDPNTEAITTKLKPLL